MTWDHAGNRHQRGYGSRWTKLREAIMDRDKALCQPCEREGRGPRSAHAVDHIKPKHLGGDDDPENLQAICNECHDLKTRAENAARNRGNRPTIGPDGWPVGDETHGLPFRLNAPAIPVTLVCGPPGSGKTTWAREQAGPSDTIIDLDDCKESVGGKRWDDSGDVWRRAINLRDDRLRGLAHARGGHAYVIHTGPSQAARDAWAKALRAKVHVIKTPPDVCIERIRSDPRRADAATKLTAAVREWHRQWVRDQITEAAAGTSHGRRQ